MAGILDSKLISTVYFIYTYKQTEVLSDSEKQKPFFFEWWKLELDSLH